MVTLSITTGTVPNDPARSHTGSSDQLLTYVPKELRTSFRIKDSFLFSLFPSNSPAVSSVLSYIQCECTSGGHHLVYV